MKHFFVFITLLLAGFQFSYSQNLVVNPSFENNTGCPMGPSELTLATNWTDPYINLVGDTCSTSDYYHTCNPLGGLGTGVPNNIMGNESAHTGNGYAGIIIYEGFPNPMDPCASVTGSGWREYVQSELTTPLSAGQQYCVSFWVSLADNVKWASNNFGVHLSPTQVAINCGSVGSNSDLSSYGVTPQLVYSGSPIMTSNGWTLLQFTYTATGGERYIVIGNFYGNSGTTYTCANSSAFNPYSYYYVDDVSVIQDICCDATFNSPSSLCVSASAVTLTPTTAGGTWSGPGVNSSGVFNPATAGVGTHTITYALSCGSESTTITVSACTPINVCVESNGNLTASGGTNPYSWQQQTTTQDCSSCLIGCIMPPGCAVNVTQWTTFTTGASISAPASYPIQVVDGTGTTLIINNASSLPSCSANPCATVTITATITPTHPTCTTAGSAIATPSGGTGSYTYSWNTTPPQTNATANGLTAGSYTVTVTDANGCTGTQSVTINAPAQAPTVTTASTNAGCNGVLGTATATVTGGTTPYSYSWNTTPPQTNATANGLAAGNYTVTVTDAGGCTATQNVTVGQTSGLSVSVSGVNVSCNGGSNGSATATPNGGTTPYSYVWSPSGGNAAVANNLVAGTYTVNVTDANGCTAQGSVQITQPAAATITMSSTQTQCLVNSGTATASISGGQSPYSYSWNTTPPQTNATATGLAAGNYTVTVTDANNCQTTGNVLVGAVNAPTISVVSSQEVSCFGDANGTAQVAATGGTPAYTYTWSPGNLTGASVSNLAPGTYTATVVDNSGCTNLTQVTINEPDALVVTESVVHANCGVDDGEISLTVTGGTGAYSYSWTPNVSTTNSATGLAIGNYTIDVTDAMGCTESVSVIVTTNTTFAIDVTPNVVVVNPGASVVLDLEVEPGIVVSTITWTPAAGLSCTDCENPVASPTQTTTYYVTVESDNGCISTDSVVIVVQDPCGELFVPTIFSPNDDGLNDLECVMGSCVTAIDFTIYNRWGEVVFMTKERDECWDGNFRGKPAQTGVYVYKLKAILEDGQIITQSGNINLTR